MLRIFLPVIFLLVIIRSSSPYPLVNSITDCFMQSPYEVQLFLTISSLYSSTTEQDVVKRPLEVNWVGLPSPGSTIAIYDSDPVIHPSSKPLSSFSPLENPGGYFRSDILLPIKFFNRSSLNDDHCLGYWSAYLDKNGNIKSSVCLEIRPFWMERIAAHLSDQKLNEIMIPGSHDSGSFYIHRETEPLSKYMYAQEESIYNQMVYGLRYFDLRVGHYPKSREKYYINHNFLRTDHSVKSVLRQVMKFIKSTKKEIVILDFHNFPVGFSDNITHLELLRIISKAFGSYLVPYRGPNQIPTFSEMWKHGKRVVVSYDNILRQEYYSSSMWPSIPRAWGNKQHPEDLKAYFKDVFRKPLPQGLWAAMAELTPNTKTIILHPETGLRIFADKVNKNVTHWFRDIYWQKANIIATDYFLGNDIIDVAIRTNKIKGLCPESSWGRLNP